MNPNPTPPDDPALHELLCAARPKAELPPGFATGVWRRIQRREAAAADSWLERLLGLVLRPQWAAAGLAAVMLAGVLLGTRTSPAAEQASAQARYVASVNPFQPRP